MQIKPLLFTILSTISTSAAAQYAYAPVITFNMANYNDHGNWEQRLQSMADEIERNHASIIVLQEVRFDPNEPSTKRTHQNMAEQLLTTLQQRHDFNDAEIVTQPVMYYGDKWEGLSIISKYHILETGSRFLSKNSNCTDNNVRATQYAKLDINGSNYIIANTHFGLTSACIKSNIVETADYLQKISDGTGMMLLGDFNTTPNNPALALLEKAGLTDVWDKLRPNESGYTFPANHPSTRIDYVFANTQLLQRIHGKEYVRVVGDKPDNRVFASDHLGVVTEFLAY